MAAIFGGSGFLGRYAVNALARDGWRIRSASRRPHLAGHLLPMGDVGQIHAVQANVRYACSVTGPVERVEAVVNLVGIATESGSQSFQDVHVAGARAVAKAAREAGAKILVHVSALCAHANSPSEYGQTKAEGEAAALEEFPDAVILRPSLMFGAEDQLFNRIAALARRSPFVPLVGGGRTKVQVIYVGDVAAAIASACRGEARSGTIYELGGPEITTWRGLCDDTLAWSGRRRYYVPIPFWLAKLAAATAALIPQTLRPLTIDEVAMLQQSTLVSDTAVVERRTLSDLVVKYPHTTVTVVPGYLQRFHRRGQFARHRRVAPR